MEYNTHLDIVNLEENDFRDEFTCDLAALVYMIRKPLLQLEEVVFSPDFKPKKDNYFVAFTNTGVIQNVIYTLVPQIKDSEYSHVFDACINAVNTLYRDKIFSDLREHYDEKAEIDKSLVEGGELDADEVMEFTDDELNAHIDYTLLPRLALINLAFYVTYKGRYNLLELDDIDNPAFWYNEHFDLFIQHMNYRHFVTDL